MRRLIFAIASMTLAAMPQSVLAWGKTGHRVVADVADHYLSPEARGNVQLILGTESLAEASNWPDFMKSDPDEYWQKTASPWHYVTVPAGQAYDKAPLEGDAMTALRSFTAIVRDEKKPLSERKMALRFIIHIVGDLHQPLHVGNGTDRGGNDVKVAWFGKDTNLHSVWDSELIDDQQLSYTEISQWLRTKVTAQELKTWTTARPADWLNQSARLRDTIYRSDPKLSWRYVYDTKAQLDEQLTRGGLNLAAYLNWTFSKQP